MKKPLQIFIVAIFVWALLSWGTETLNPVESIENLLNTVKDLAMATRLTHATEDDNGDVQTSVDDLAAEASATLGEPVSPAEYALARMVRNENTQARKGGNDAERAAIIWVCMNDAAANDGGDIVRCITGKSGKFGHQTGRKYASGRDDPYDIDLDLVRRCYNGQIPDPTGGRTHFMHRNGFETHEKYLATVEKWNGRGWRNSGLDFGTSLEVWT
jgi:hypothetical protein